MFEILRINEPEEKKKKKRERNIYREREGEIKYTKKYEEICR